MPVPWELFVWILSVYASYRFVRTLVALTWAVLVYRVIPRFRQPNLKRYEPRWTVVSGGTDGIGKAYVFELASRGLWKFILIGRNQDKLNAVKEELERNNEASQVKTYLFDFYNGDYQALRNYLTDVDIGFVVNSVGVGRKYLERYGDNPEADNGVLKVNALGSAEFMSMVLRPMERHGGGQIVVLSSSQGYRPIPYLASYCASKSLVSFLSESIDREYDSIRVQCLTPALVATNMTYYKNGSLFVVTPDDFVREAVSTIGVATTTSGCFNHEIQMLLRHLFPWRILKHLVMPIYWRHQKRLLKLHGEHNQ